MGQPTRKPTQQSLRLGFRFSQKSDPIYTFLSQGTSPVNAHTLVRKIIEDSIRTGRAKEIKKSLSHNLAPATASDATNQVSMKQEIDRLNKIIEKLAQQQGIQADTLSMADQGATGIQLIQQPCFEQIKETPQEPTQEPLPVTSQSSGTSIQPAEARHPNKTVKKALKHIYMEPEFRAEVEARHNTNENTTEQAKPEAMIDNRPDVVVSGIVYLTEEEQDAL